MRVVVQALDGSKIYPVYSPEHKETVVSFYANLVANGSISGYVIIFDNDTVMAEGKVL